MAVMYKSLILAFASIIMIFLSCEPGTLAGNIIALSAKDAHNGKVKLTWAQIATNDFSCYKIYQSEDELLDIQSAKIIKRLDEARTSSYMVTGLKNGVKYYFAVVAFDKKDNPLTTYKYTCAISTHQAEVVLINGKIITVDGQDSVAQAVAITRGRIIKVGSNEEVLAITGQDTDVMDLRGKCVTPGLIDSHLHVYYFGQQFREGSLNVRYPLADSKEKLLALVAEKAKYTPKGAWIASNQGFCLADKRFAPDRWELDAIAPDNPVYLLDATGQFAVVNSYAFKLVGIDMNTPNPYGSIIEKDDKTGQLTGFLFHYPAIDLVRRRIPGYEYTPSSQEAFIKIGSELCLKAGYTSVQDVILMSPILVVDYESVADKHELPIRINMMHYIANQEQAVFLLGRPYYLKGSSQVKNEWCNFEGWKLAIDGCWTNGTVLMYDTTIPAAAKSYPYHTQEYLNKVVSMLHKSGLQVAFHVHGDRAIDMALNAVEAALKEFPRTDHRHRLEHVTFPSKENLERIKKLGLIVSTSPQWVYTTGDGIKYVTNPTIAEHMLPVKTMLDMGIPVAFGCDEPSAQFLEPKWNLLGAVMRKTMRGEILGAGECISIHQALRCLTMGSAYAAFEENIKGSIEDGKLADLVVWSHDLYTMPSSDLQYLTAVATLVDGKVVYKMDSSELSFMKGSEYLKSK